MQGDIATAAGVLEGSRRALKSFSQRFDDAVQAAFQHEERARPLGLEYPRYFSAVAEAASRTLFASLPRREADLDWDRQVKRLLGRRDFGLITLMKQGDDAAWEVFRETYSDYLETLLLRSGFAPGEIPSIRDELLSELRGNDEVLSPLADWLGRSDLRHWLLCYVLEVFRGGAPRPHSDGSEPPRRHSTTEAGRSFIAGVEAEFRVIWDDLSGSRRELLRGVSTGAPLVGQLSELSDLSGRHEAVMEEIWRELVRRVAKNSQARPDEVDAVLRETFVGEVESEVARLREGMESGE